MDAGRRVPATTLAAGAMALAGVIVIADGVARDTLPRYRWFALACGALLLAPLVLVLVWPERGRRSLRAAAFLAVPTAAALLLGEGLFRLLGPAAMETRLVGDPRLGHVLAPGPGVDEHGFRGGGVPEPIDVLVVGDSQTYGFGVEPGQSFPARLAQRTGLRVYAAALIEYGPVQYRELVRRFAGRGPRWVVVGLYLGNDVLDAWRFAGLESGADLRAAGRTYPPPAVAELTGKPAPNLAYGAFEALLSVSRLARWSHRQVVARVRASTALARLHADEPGAPGHSAPPIATLFTPSYRLAAVDPDAERVRDGLRITRACLRDIAADCGARGARLVVLAIPTKEACYQRLYESTGGPNPALAALAGAERAIRAELRAGAAEVGALWVDPEPAAARALAAGVALWPPSSDGHPSVRGYDLLAAALARTIEDAR